MVGEAEKIGELLRLPDLEAETKALINAKMREFIGATKPLSPAQKEEVANVMNEWLNGAQEGGA